MASWNPDGMIEAMKPKPSDNAKESFVEGAVDYTYEGTKSKDTDITKGRNFNEKVLHSQQTVQSTPNKVVSDAEKTATGATPPSYMDEVKKLQKQFDIMRFRKLIANLVKAIPESIDEAVKSFAELIVAFYYPETEVQEAKKSKKVIIDQINLYLIIPLSFWVALNWLYVWNYTNFTFNFMDALKYPPFNIIYYVAEPGFYVLELMNYYMLTMRMDKDLPCWKRDILNTLWDWRPVVFTLFAFSMAGLLPTMPVSETAGGMTGGDSTMISGIIFIGTIVAFAYLTLTCISRMVHFNTVLQNAFLLAFVMLLFFLFVLIIAGLASSVALLYFMFFSQMVLIVFERFNFIAKIHEMVTDLRTAPVNNPEATLTTMPFTFLKQLIFRNFFVFCWAFLVVIPMFIYSMVKISTISNFPMMITLIIFVIILDLILMAPAIDLLSTLVNFINKIIEQNNPIVMKEEPVRDPVPPPSKPTPTGKDESKSMFDDLLLFMMNPLRFW